MPAPDDTPARIVEGTASCSSFPAEIATTASRSASTVWATTTAASDRDSARAAVVAGARTATARVTRVRDRSSFAAR